MRDSSQISLGHGIVPVTATLDWPDPAAAGRGRGNGRGLATTVRLLHNTWGPSLGRSTLVLKSFLGV